jgi:hypothetical protein
MIHIDRSRTDNDIKNQDEEEFGVSLCVSSSKLTQCNAWTDTAQIPNTYAHRLIYT